jgi:serine/threonine protein kinase
MSMIGKTLAHYEITSQLGKGGMGDVYQAKDRKLGRDVAIKVLPEEFAKDTDRVARFQREAKLLASLNHPNIAAIYGLEKTGGTNFLILELVEGETLADLIKRGPIPVEESLKLALQIAEALEAAHEKGVIHRDLKPANIKVTPDGKVKVLDFGLAKAFAADQGMNLSNSPTLTRSPTLSDMATQQGVILGTAAYMSPEQARGKTVDKRADIWAFGVVLFEMLTGRSLFAGDDVSQTLARVLERQPDFSKLPPNLHPIIVEMLKRCLEKDARNRYSGISDARVDIQKVLADPSGVLVQPVAGMELRTSLRTILPWVSALVLTTIITGVAVWILKPAPPPEPKRVVRFDYELPAGQQFNRNEAGETQYQFAVSPDGSRFVYSTTEGLYLRSMEALNARLIAGTDKYSTAPFFSPDGQWLGYFSRSDLKLKKVAISGGARVVLCDTSALSGFASWNSDNTIIYNEAKSGLMRVPANGGTPEILIKGSVANITKEGVPTIAHMLPDGKSLLLAYQFDFNIANAQITIQSLKSGDRKVLFKSGADPRYLPTGHIVYSFTSNSSENLFAVPFDLGKLEVTGAPVSILEGIGGGAFSDSGTLVYVSQPAVASVATSATSTARTLVWVDRQGKEESLGAAPDNYEYLKISPDGTKVALTIYAGNEDIWIWDIPHKTSTKLTFDKADDANPIWTPDGTRIVFRSARGGMYGGVYWKSADGIGEDELLASKPDRHIFPWSFFRDGKTLVLYELYLIPLGVDIGILSMEGKREMKALLQEKNFELEPQISPDGRFVAYQSDESGKGEIYVRSFPDVSKGKWQVSSGGGGSPLWSSDGRELFYRSSNATMAVEVETGPTFKRGNPKILFQGTYLSNTMQKVVLTPWDIHPNGKKFLMIKPPASTGAAPTAASPQPKINIVLNWFEELKQRVPVK